MGHVLAALVQQPYIVKLYEKPQRQLGVADVLFRALGFTGILILIAIVAAVAAGTFLYWRRSREH